MHINDIKRQGLLQLLVKETGHIDDLWYQLIHQIVLDPKGEHINDLWQTYLNEKGYNLGSVDDNTYQWLLDQGYPPWHIDDMWYAFWENIGEQPPGVAPYEFEMPDLSIQPYEFDGGLGDYLFEIFVFT